MGNKKNDFFEIDIIEVLLALWHKLWIILLTAALCAGIAFSYAYYKVTPQYQSSVLLYVNNSSFSLSSANFSINSGDISAAKSLVSTYLVILDTRSTLEEVIEKADLNCSYGTLSRMISATAVNNTEIFRVTVTAPNPRTAATIANTIAQVLPEKISSIVDGSSVRVVDYAVIPRGKVSPNMARYTLVGALIGAFLSGFLIVLSRIRDNLVHDDDYLTRNYDVPMLAVVPDLNATKTNQYGYYKRSTKKYGTAKYGAAKYATSKYAAAKYGAAQEAANKK